LAYAHFAYTYDRLMQDTPYGEWLRFADEIWRRYGKPGTIVDLGCGTGNIAIPLAQAGFTVYGIDLSEDMLSVARDKWERFLRGALAHRGSVTWLQQDMREWELDEPVDCVLSFCDCMNYLREEEEVLQVMRRTYDGLKPGGLFVFDLHTPSLLRAYAEEQPFVLDEEDIAYLWTCSFDEERCEIEHDLTIFARDEPRPDPCARTAGMQPLFRRIRETHIQRAYPLDRIRQGLNAAGFLEVVCCGDFAWHPPAEGTQRVFWIARRG